jgi:NADH dehydrogenase
VKVNTSFGFMIELRKVNQLKQTMKNIVIVGAGFGGLTVALELEKTIGQQGDVAITLIDKEPYHLFHANLYEVATGPEEMTTLDSLKKTVAFPLEEILYDKQITFIHGAVDTIQKDQKTLMVAGKQVAYDYLVVACGSTNNFFGVPGVAEDALTLKTLPDAFRIRSNIETVIQKASSEVIKPELRFVIGGGGFTGVELAGELVGLFRLLSWKYSFPLDKIEILIVEGMNRLLPGLDDAVGQDVARRLRDLGVRVQLNSMITELDHQFITFKNGERLEYNLLVWTAGVKACTIGSSHELVIDKGCRVATTGCLECTSLPDVHFLGDQAAVMDGQGKPLPGTASQALHQAQYLARHISDIISGKPSKDFVARQFGYVIPVGGKWAVFKNGPWYFTGRFAYFLRELRELQYFSTLVGWWKALKMIVKSDQMYSRND